MDRLYGYEVSPVLWKKIMPRLSAGRVQSVATRVIVERERARIRFNRAGYWDLEGTFRLDADPKQELAATSLTLGGMRIASGKDFGEDGRLQKESIVLLDEAKAKSLSDEFAQRPFAVQSVETKPYRRSPAAPFMTSTLQQEAGRKLRFSSARTMKAAQRLYENGYITYMRTDSTTLSASAITSARAQIKKLYGADYLPPQPRVYAKKVKNAQEAHEAIRPAGEVFQLPEAVANSVTADERQLYELVWKRTVASQMQDARGQSVSLRLAAKNAAGVELVLGCEWQYHLFPRLSSRLRRRQRRSRRGVG